LAADEPRNREAAQQLSLAQQRRVEMLQRTLREGKQATEADLIADVAV
jgi:hypothetical protein